MPVTPPTRYNPLHGSEARQLATWLVRWSRRKPACRLAPRAHCWLLKVRRGRLPLSAGRFYAILRYVELQKRLHEPTPMRLNMTPGALGVKWGVEQSEKGQPGAGPGNPPPLIPQRNFRG